MESTHNVITHRLIIVIFKKRSRFRFRSSNIKLLLIIIKKFIKTGKIELYQKCPESLYSIWPIFKLGNIRHCYLLFFPVLFYQLSGQYCTVYSSVNVHWILRNTGIYQYSVPLVWDHIKWFHLKKKSILSFLHNILFGWPIEGKW